MCRFGLENLMLTHMGPSKPVETHTHRKTQNSRPTWPAVGMARPFWSEVFLFFSFPPGVLVLERLRVVVGANKTNKFWELVALYRAGYPPRE